MQIKDFEWNEEIIFHIARHNVTLQEVEKACFSFPLVLRGKKNSYYVLGRAISGRYLVIVIRRLNKGKVKVITARDMDNKERKRFIRR